MISGYPRATLGASGRLAAGLLLPRTPRCTRRMSPLGGSAAVRRNLGGFLTALRTHVKHT
jgi:hypothetical protein